MISYFYWDPHPEIFSIPYLHFPILWYGVFFALGFWLAFLVFVQILTRYFSIASNGGDRAQWKQQAQGIADRLTLYVVIGTLLGARLGHFLFYERPSDYLADPMEFFRFRNGGLASHGAILGIIIAVFLFSLKIRKRHPDLNWVRLLDCLAAPTALAGASIRVGNFFNQEILGAPTDLPWAILFAHPADGSLAVPRHPAQLYEAIGYLLLFSILWRWSQRPFFLLKRGRLIGLFLIGAFIFRFLIEFLKPEQSHLLRVSSLNMGQILSIPAILLGCFFFLKKSR